MTDPTRRQFLGVVGAAGLAAMGGPVAAQQITENAGREFHGVALLYGPADARPDPDSDFFENDAYSIPVYHYLYLATNGARYTIETGDEQWTSLPVHANAITIPGTIDTFIKTTTELEQKFTADNFEDGETIYIGGPNLPLRPSQELVISGATGVSITGPGRDVIAIKVADSPGGTVRFITKNTGGFPDQLTIRDLGWDGNVGNVDGNETKFMQNNHATNLHVLNCGIQNLAPANTHSGGGTGILNKAFGDGNPGLVVEGCLFDNVGDQCIDVNSSQARLVGNRATNGYDRMISLNGATDVFVGYNISVDNADGSAYGISDGAGVVERVLFLGNWGIGDQNDLFTFEETSNNGVFDVWCIGNVGVPSTGANQSANNNNTVHQQGTTGARHVYLGNYGENRTEAGYEITFDDTLIDYFTEVSPGTYGVELVSAASPADVEIGRHYNITSPGSADFSVSGGTRPVLAGVGLEDLGTSPTSAPTGAYREGSVIRNSNAGNNETWVRARGTWVQIA